MFIKVDVQMRQGGIKELKGACLSVYLALACHMNWEGVAFPSLDTLVEETGYSRRFIQRALRRLEESGYIERTSISTRSTAYCLNHYVAIGKREQLKEEGVIPNKENVENYALSRTYKKIYENDDDKKYTSSIYSSTLGEDFNIKPTHKTTLSKQESTDTINRLKEFGFWDAQEFVQENDLKIIRETIAEVEEVQGIVYDPEKLRQRIMKGGRHERLKNPGGYLRQQVRRKIALRQGRIDLHGKGRKHLCGFGPDP